MNLSDGEIVAMLIDPKTDGCVPIGCKLTNVGKTIQLQYGGLDGWIIQIPIHDLQDVIGDDDLHG